MARYAAARWAVPLCAACFVAGGSVSAEVALVTREVAPPHFQLHLPGHTATVLALAYLPEANGPSPLIVSAGRDKVARVWRAGEPAGANEGVRGIVVGGPPPIEAVAELRWQIGPGPKGIIYSLAVRPPDASRRQPSLVALAGNSVMGSSGNIVLIHPETGRTERVLEGHRQIVTWLDFSPDGRQLVSSSADGRTLIWSEHQGDWKSREMVAADRDNLKFRELLGTGDALRRFTERLGASLIRPAVFLDDRRVVIAEPDPATWQAGRKPERPIPWRLREVQLADNSTLWRSPRPFFGSPVLAASPRGDQFAVGTARLGRVTCWKREPAGDRRRLTLDAPLGTRSLAYSADGSKLAVGSLVGVDTGRSQLELWNTATGKSLKKIPGGSQPVSACAFAPDDQQIAFMGGSGQDVTVHSLSDPDGRQPDRVFRSPLRPIVQVAFEDRPGSYRIAWTTRPGAPPDRMADLRQLRFAADDDVPQDIWRSPEATGTGWTTSIEDASNPPRRVVVVRHGERELTRIGFDPALEDAASYCWIPDKQGGYGALAVGTRRRNHIHVYDVPKHADAEQLDPNPPWPRLRVFRGHTDAVLSLSASADARYLVSGGADGTVRFWSLDGLGERTVDLWGAEFKPQPAAAQPVGVEARAVNKAGPLYQQGVRDGDLLTSLHVPPAAVRDDLPAVTDTPEGLLRRLRADPLDANVQFRFQRRERARAAFQIPPAWPPLASLLWMNNREWAVWTPAGYYAASPNGNEFLGWQVDRGPDQTPDYVSASPLWERLERRPAIKKLLEAGSLAGALSQAGGGDSPAGPLHADSIVVRAPVVQIQPLPRNRNYSEPTVHVVARVKRLGGTRLTKRVLFANGVPGKLLRESKVDESDRSGWLQTELEWEVPLPPDEKVELLAMIGGNADGIPSSFGRDRHSITRRNFRSRPGRLYLFTVGVNDYAHLSDLNFAVQDADGLSRKLGDHAKPVFERVWQAAPLRDRDVTLQTFQTRLDEFITFLGEEQVSPEDLIVIFLAGHGVEKDGRYYFTPHDAELDADRPTRRQTENLIPLSVFETLALNVPCRKLALLDTCRNSLEKLPQSLANSGIVQRELEDAMIFTLTACEYGERAFEDPELRHGLFTQAVIEAVAGAADQSQDNRVDLWELVAYVKDTVPRMSERLGWNAGRRQHPSFAPAAGLNPSMFVPIAQP